MKPLKFKAYVREYDRIVEVEQLELLANGEAQSIVVADWELTDETYRFTKGQFELMQYTGLNDKNKVKIYEGYILRFSNGNIGKVFWSNLRAGFDVAFNGAIPEELDVGLADRSEVIGNIHENKELLDE